MHDPVRQLPLTLPHETAMTRADFLVGDANRAALALIDSFPDWPHPLAVLIGPSGAGKSHLAEIWRASTGAAIVRGRRLDDADLDAVVLPGSFIVEDLHEPGIDQAALFHLLNLAKERGASGLLTSRLPIGGLGLTLPDLSSRLRAAVPATLVEPDDDLLARVIVKLFADRQLEVEPLLVEFIQRRMERSLGAANRIVALLDQAALAAGRPVTRQLAASVLADEFGERSSGLDP